MSFTKVSQEKQRPTLRPTLVLAPSPDIDKVISFDSSIEVFHYNYRVPINVVKTIKTFKLVDGARCFYIKKAPSTFTIKDFDPFDCFKSQIVSTDMGLNFFVMPDCGIDLSDFIAYTFAESRGYSKRFEVLSKTPKGVATNEYKNTD